jgi:3,4-dihydroxy-2-butanone 4-phosphate synthase
MNTDKAPIKAVTPFPTTNQEIILDSVADAILAIQQGQFVVVVDDMDRENEGDLIIAAQMISTEKMAWMIKHTS